ncbi:hypothetical protein [Sphingomonas oryzagri]
MNKGAKLDKGDFLASVPRFAPEAMASNEALVELLRQIADDKG